MKAPKQLIIFKKEDWVEPDSPGEIHITFNGMPKSITRDPLFLEKLLETGDLSDVTVRIRDREFKLHKLILANNSTYFRTLFYGSFQESSKSTVELHDADPRIFKFVVWFMYSGWYSPHMGPIDNAEMFIAGVYLDVPRLRDHALYWLWDDAQSIVKEAKAFKPRVRESSEDEDAYDGVKSNVLNIGMYPTRAEDQESDAYDWAKIRGKLARLAWALQIICTQSSRHDRHQQGHLDECRKRDWPECKYFQILETCFMDGSGLLDEFLVDSEDAAVKELREETEELYRINDHILEQWTCSAACYYCRESAEATDFTVGFFPCGFLADDWKEESKWTKKEVIFFDCNHCGTKRGAYWKCSLCKSPKMKLDNCTFKANGMGKV